MYSEAGAGEDFGAGVNKDSGRPGDFTVLPGDLQSASSARTATADESSLGAADGDDSGFGSHAVRVRPGDFTIGPDYSEKSKPEGLAAAVIGELRR